MLNHIFIYFCLSFLISGVSFCKTFDCFLFFNELELLKIRFEELYDIVDYFVLVESSETFTGKDKELFFKKNTKQFEKYIDKIIYVECPKILTNDPWYREKYQRDYIKNGLTFCNKNDLILISDVDEIPKAKTLDNLKNSPISFFKKPLVFDMKLYRFYINLYENQWPGTVISLFEFVKKAGANSLRNYRNIGRKISDGGWHFTSLGGEDRVLYKLSSYSHTEHNIFTKGQFEQIKKFWDPNATKVTIDDSYPKTILDNIKFYRELGFIIE